MAHFHVELKKQEAEVFFMDAKWIQFKVKKFVRNIEPMRLVALAYALSFYSFQNVLSRSKFFEPVQKFIGILCLVKNFCAGTKTKFTEWKSFFGVAQNVWYWHQYQLVQPKTFGSYKNILGPVEGQGI